MRRGRDLREYRESRIRHKKVITLSEQRKVASDKLVNKKKSKTIIVTPDESAKLIHSDISPITISSASTKRRPKPPRRAPSGSGRGRAVRSTRTGVVYDTPSSSPLALSFITYSDYKCLLTKPVNVCHVIESLGMGGAQTMMLELVNGLNNYFGEHTNNFVICTHHKSQSVNKQMYGSYGIVPEWVYSGDLRHYLESKKIDIVLHHRIAVSMCLKGALPKQTKYILLNHTWNGITRMNKFTYCDAYVSVCKFLHNQSVWDKSINQTRKIVILNGVESDYISSLHGDDIDGTFKTGRCHRLISSKFRADSLNWMNKHIAPVIDGYKHYIIGSSEEAKVLSSKYKWIKYCGPILNRDQKMSIIKQLDVYFYETFCNEGASVAVLESLACGVPVLAKKLGGTGEMVTEGVNGFICPDRNIFELRLKQLSHNPDLLADLKESTKRDFEARLHIKHAACKYMQLFESLMI